MKIERRNILVEIAFEATITIRIRVRKGKTGKEFRKRMSSRGGDTQ